MTITHADTPSFTGQVIQFTVPCVPVSQPRQRHRIINGRAGAFAQNYTPTGHPVNAYKAACQLAAQQAYDGPPLEGPLYVAMRFVMPRVKPSWVKKTSRWWDAWKAGQRVPYIGNKDRDNLMKSTQDCLNKILWADDRQLFTGPVEKWVAAEDEQPHVEIVVETML